MARHFSVTPLNSARDVGVRIVRYRLSNEALALLNELRIPHDCTINEALYMLEDRMRLMNPDQRRRLLQRMAKLKEQLR